MASTTRRARVAITIRAGVFGPAYVVRGLHGQHAEAQLTMPGLDGLFPAYSDAPAPEAEFKGHRFLLRDIACYHARGSLGNSLVRLWGLTGVYSAGKAGILISRDLTGERDGGSRRGLALSRCDDPVAVMAADRVGST